MLFDVLLGILSVNRFEIVLLPRGCYTTRLVIFTGTDFHETGHNSFLPLVVGCYKVEIGEVFINVGIVPRLL